jgi:hypothetical protein
LARFNGVSTKNLLNYLGWRRALEAWGDQLAPQAWIKGAIDNGAYQQLLCSGSREKARLCIRRRDGGRRSKAKAAQRWERSFKTTVDQTLIRGLATAVRVFVSGLSSV